MPPPNQSTHSRLTAHSLSYSSKPGHPPIDSSWDIDETNNFLRSSRRAGGSYLCSLPKKYTGLYPSLVGDTHKRILSIAGKILDEEGICCSCISTGGRLSAIMPEPGPISTVEIIVRENNNKKDWREVARRIYREVVDVFPGISVNMIDKEEDVEPRYWPVFKGDSIFAKWGEIVARILRDLDFSRWTSLQCWRFGKGDREENPVTVIVTVEHMVKDSFVDENRKIQDILSSFAENDVAVVFFKDEFKEPALVDDKRLSRKMADQKVVPGVRVEIHGSEEHSSFFGGTVELLFDGQEEWKPYGLACFHSARASCAGESGCFGDRRATRHPPRAAQHQRSQSNHQVP